MGEVESLEDLTPGIELFHTLIGLERYEDAFVVFRDHLSNATLYRLSANRQRAELLERLFPDGVDTLPRLARRSARAARSMAGAGLQTQRRARSCRATLSACRRN